jgi:hypothetical protein
MEETDRVKNVTTLDNLDKLTDYDNKAKTMTKLDGGESFNNSEGNRSMAPLLKFDANSSQKLNLENVGEPSAAFATERLAMAELQKTSSGANNKKVEPIGSFDETKFISAVGGLSDSRRESGVLSRRLVKTEEYGDDDSQVSGDQYSQTMGSAQLTYVNTAGVVATRKANPRFKSFKHVFENLLKSVEVQTNYSIVTMGLSNDSKVCITVSKADDCSYFINQYNVETQDCTFEEMIG